MKITIDEKPKKKDPELPCLMKSIHSGIIVLMVEKSVNGWLGLSFPVNNTGSPCYLAWDKTSFEPFNGTITLQNSED